MRAPLTLALLITLAVPAHAVAPHGRVSVPPAPAVVPASGDVTPDASL